MQGHFPSRLKTAKVIPIYKKGNISEFNYRQISILKAFSKVFEMVLSNQLLNFLENRGIFTKQQYGFRKGVSTIDAVLSLVNCVKQSFEQ